MAVVASMVLVAGPASAGTQRTAAASPAAATAAQACSVWLDYANGRGRGHANCPGFYVTVRVYCANGSAFNSSPYWRLGYNKAECPIGVGAIGVTHATMHA